MRLASRPRDSARAVFTVVRSCREYKDVIKSGVFDCVVNVVVPASEPERHDDNVNFPIVYSIPDSLDGNLADIFNSSICKKDIYVGSHLSNTLR